MYVICSDLVGPEWDQQIRRWLRRIIPTNEEFKYTCSGRCGVDERDFSARQMDFEYLPLCFCDKLCDELGDCCFDFNEL